MFNFKFLRKMNLKRTQQVEAQGVKKLDNFKGFETLNSKQLQEIEGGNPGVIVAVIVAIGLFGAGVYNGYKEAEKK